MSSKHSNYTPEFFAEIQESASRSASGLVPLLMRLIKPGSVLDVGCGTGAWLAAFRDRGVSDIFGVDGNFVERSRIDLSHNQFQATDLNKPIDLGREFDLVLSFEVAEHLQPDAAGGFVNSLTKHGKVVAFSAAIPGQGGTRHINEQWPGFWIDKFRACGYEPLDILRPLIWNDPQIAVWYRQNAMLFVDPQVKLDVSNNDAEADFRGAALVHPEIFRDAMTQLRSAERARWDLETELIAREIAMVVHSGARFILLDDHKLSRKVFADYVDVPEIGAPFPGDGAEAVEMCRRATLESGAAYMAIVQHAFWWSDLPEFRTFLERSAKLVFSSQRVRVFRFLPRPPPS